MQIDVGQYIIYKKQAIIRTVETVGFFACIGYKKGKIFLFYIKNTTIKIVNIYVAVMCKGKRIG